MQMNSKILENSNGTADEKAPGDVNFLEIQTPKKEEGFEK